MGTSFRLDPLPLKQNSNPTTQQRAIYYFYEERYSDEAEDIYSAEWFNRTSQYLSKVDQHPKPLQSWQQIEEMTFGSFFLAHPVAAFSLWQMMQAFYKLDGVVCHLEKDQAIIRSWQELPPFQYLNASKKKGRIEKKWQSSLQAIGIDISSKALKGDLLVSRLYDMLCGVERLEKAYVSLQENFSHNLRNIMFVKEMLENILSAVEIRREMIGGLSGSNVNNQHSSE